MLVSYVFMNMYYISTSSNSKIFMVGPKNLRMIIVIIIVYMKPGYSLWWNAQICCELQTWTRLS